MPHVVAHAMTSHVHCVVHTCRQASHPYDFMVCHTLIIYLPFAQAKRLLLKLIASHVNALNNKNTKENMLKRISLPC